MTSLVRLVLFFGTLLASLSVVADEASAQSCGGNNQRYCCIWEGAACDPGHAGILATGPGSGDACTNSGFPLFLNGSSLGTCYTTGTHPNFCGRKNLAPCAVTVQVSLGISACQSGLVQLLGSSGIRCREIGSNGFPTHCGGLGQAPCLVTENIPSCSSDYFEYNNVCNDPDPDGYPTFCGDLLESPCNASLQVQLGITSCKASLVENGGLCVDSDSLFPPQCGDQDERACTVLENIPSCKSGLVEFLSTAGATCRLVDGDGYPTHCGDTSEVACEVTERIPSCKEASDYELAGVCTATDTDGYPDFCGDLGEDACNLALQIQLGITSCKPGLEEDLINGICVDDFPPDCGRAGQRACGLLENIPSCQSNAYEITTAQLPFPDNGWCVDLEYFPSARLAPASVQEAAPGPKSVFLIHGLGSGESAFGSFDLGSFDLGAAGEGLTVYVVDYNSDGTEGDPPVAQVEPGLRVRHVPSTGTSLSSCVIPGRLDGFTFSLPTISRLLNEAILNQAECRIPSFVPGPENVALVAHSMGGIVARDLIYRYFDSLLDEGIRITDVITLGTPHRGGGASIPEASDLAFVTCPLQFDSPLNHQVCLLERWHEALRQARQDADALGAPFIDNMDFPEIRWTTIAAADSQFPDPVAGSVLSDFVRHDGLVAHTSSFSLASDLCFPNVDGATPPTGITDRSIANIDASDAWFGHSWPPSVVVRAGLALASGDYSFNPWNGFNLGPMNLVTSFPSADDPGSLTSECHSPGPSKAYPGRSYLDPDVAPEKVAFWAQGETRFIGFPDTTNFDAPHGDLIGAQEADNPASHIAMRHYVKTVLTDGLRTWDVNQDGVFSYIDFQIVEDAISDTVYPSAYFAGYDIRTDLNGDGFTTIDDLAIVVPEPGFGIGIVIGAVLLGGLGRSRFRPF